MADGTPHFDRSLVSLHGELTSYLRRRGVSPEDAEEVVQEAFLRFHRAGYDYAAPDGRPLIFAIAKNVRRDRARSQDRARAAGMDDAASLPEWQEAATDEPTPERKAIAAEELAQAMARIRALPTRTRQVFLLHRFAGQNYGQIARKVGISVSAVEKHIAEALRRLREEDGE